MLLAAPLLQCLIVPPFLTGRGTSACRRRGPRITRATVLSGSRGDGATDWDGEWSRWQQRVSGESSAGGVDAPLPADELGQGGKENRGQVESWSDDELQRLRLEDRLKQQLPYEYEEIEELYHRIAADESFGASGITIARRKTWSERAPFVVCHRRAVGCTPLPGRRLPVARIPVAHSGARECCGVPADARNLCGERGDARRGLKGEGLLLAACWSHTTGYRCSLAPFSSHSHRKRKSPAAHVRET